MAAHYGCAIVPARPRKPRDKAKVESAVLKVERWILALMRNRMFFSVEEADEAVAQLVDELNERPLQEAAWLPAEPLPSNGQPGAATAAFVS